MDLAKVGVEGSNPFARSMNEMTESRGKPRLFAYRGYAPGGFARGSPALLAALRRLGRVVVSWWSSSTW